ncbi:lipocalin-like domain-containing protein [Vibrio sp. ZSDE26]|uniref:Lipocalin-like domain-containing protein n=1 Tax=Vibrio amylolyticus TaxID=2847292 RepID=A0A9X2BHX4_9VIBR|nr:lipocalin-like domain-containing protein [Vibrio amylolyticus]MCK6264379.1 lipocalin-like domain-containing protein [Vibrio amylolyticus]
MINKKSLIGEWRLIDAQMTVSGKTENTFDANREMVKLFTGTHFSFYSKTANRTAYSAAVTDQERLQGSKTLDAGGGRYDLLGDIYTEHVTYCTYPNYEGKSISFKLSLSGNTLTQEGDYPLKELGFSEHDGYVKEVYQRIE